MVRMKENNMTSDRKKKVERMFTIPGMEGTLTVRAANALRNIGINPADKESLKTLALWSVADKLLKTYGVGKITRAHIINYVESNGIVYSGTPDTPCLSVALKEARLRDARERREAELKRIEEQSYAVGSAWVGE